jgi:ankyrin repeat protein
MSMNISTCDCGEWGCDECYGDHGDPKVIQKIKINFTKNYMTIGRIFTYLNNHKKISLTNMDEQLITEACENNTKEVIKLIKKGADVDYQNFLGRTALMGAAGLSGVKAVKALIRSGADVNIQTNYPKKDDEDYGVNRFAYDTALSYAISDASVSCVRELLKAGANVLERDLKNAKHMNNLEFRTLHLNRILKIVDLLETNMDSHEAV